MNNSRDILGRSRSGIQLFQQALATDPLSADLYNGQSLGLSGLGRLDEATAAIHKAIALQPAAMGYYVQLAIIEIQRGDAEAALAAAQAEAAGTWQNVALALAREIGPDTAAANAALKHLIDNRADASAYQIARSMRCAEIRTRYSSGWIALGPTAMALLASYSWNRSSCATSTTRAFVAFRQKVGLTTITHAKALP